MACPLLDPNDDSFPAWNEQAATLHASMAAHPLSRSRSTQKNVERVPAELDVPIKPLPFAYVSTGDETVFINQLDPHPRTRNIFS